MAWRKIFWEPANLNDYEKENNHVIDFSLGEEVYLQWELKEDRDFATHSHIINDLNYWEIWIKSDSVNISNYSGFVQLTWIVEKFYQWNPIVKVRNLSWEVSTLVDDQNLMFDDNAGYSYIPEAWIQFLPAFYEEYLPLNDWKNWKIIFKNIESEKEIEIDYFRCNSSDPNRNCKWLSETFANGDWWWVFMNDIPDDVVFELKDMIKFANKKNIDEWIKFRAMRICQWEWEKLQRINSSEIVLKQEWLIVTVSGDGIEKQMTCQILVDFNMPLKWELQSLTIWDDVVISEENEEAKPEEENKNEEVEQPDKKDESQISATAFDTNVPQFPIKEEWLQYKSARWGYTLKFPSSNISYSVSSVKENFGRDDVKCTYVINVIKYSEKENLEISPAVRIYECDWSVGESWAQGIVVYPRLDKKFVVQMNDGAWYDFSTHLNFEELVEE